MAFSQICPGLPFVGLEIYPTFLFSAIILAPDMLATQSKALNTWMIRCQKNLSQNNGLLSWHPGPGKVGQKGKNMHPL